MSKKKTRRNNSYDYLLGYKGATFTEIPITEPFSFVTTPADHVSWSNIVAHPFPIISRDEIRARENIQSEEDRILFDSINSAVDKDIFAIIEMELETKNLIRLIKAKVINSIFELEI